MADKVAILVDGDNLSAAWASTIQARTTALGTVDIARVYLNAARPGDWLSRPGFRAIHAGCGKNATDLLLCIDAMELALTTQIRSFVLASSDGDFTHLATRLRELGRTVIGMGEAKAPETLRAACSGFVELSVPTDLNAQIRDLVTRCFPDAHWVKIADLGRLMHKEYGTGKDALPARDWWSYLSQHPDQFAVNERGPNARVCLR